MSLRVALFIMRSVYVGQFSSISGISCALNSMDQSKEAINQEAYATSKWLERQMYFYELSLKGNSPRFTNLSLLCALSEVTQVVDVGGGSGWVKNLLPKDINYRNLELVATAQYFRKKLNVEDFFVENVQEVEKSSHTILYSNSTIQYFLDQTKFDEIVSSIDAEMILFDDLYFTESTGFYSLQRYYEWHIPTYFIEKQSLIQRMKKNGYNLTLEIDYPASHSKEMLMQIEITKTEFISIDQPKTMVFKKRKD